MMGHPMQGSSILPSFTVSSSDFPEAKDWKVGKKYMVKMEVELVSQSKGFSDPLSKDLSHRFEVRRIGLEDANSPMEVIGKQGHA